MDMSLNKLRKIVKDRQAWHAAVHGVAKSWTRISNWTTITTTYNPGIPHLYIFSKGNKILFQNICALIHCRVIYKSQDMEVVCVSIDIWIVHRENGTLLNHKKNEIMPFATTGMDPEFIRLSEISHTKNTNILWFYLCLESKKQNRRTHITKQETQLRSENK